MTVLRPPPAAVDLHTEQRQRLLHLALAPFVEDIRLIDCRDLVSFIERGQFANLEDLVQSSLELSHRPGSFAFGWGATTHLGWKDRLVVALDMEFVAGGITIFFVIEIAAEVHRIVLRSIRFTEPSFDACENTQRLQAILQSTRHPQAPDKSTHAR